MTFRVLEMAGFHLLQGVVAYAWIGYGRAGSGVSGEGCALTGGILGRRPYSSKSTQPWHRQRFEKKSTRMYEIDPNQEGSRHDTADIQPYA